MPLQVHEQSLPEGMSLVILELLSPQHARAAAKHDVNFGPYKARRQASKFWGIRQANHSCVRISDRVSAPLLALALNETETLDL